MPVPCGGEGRWVGPTTMCGPYEGEGRRVGPTTVSEPCGGEGSVDVVILCPDLLFCSQSQLLQSCVQCPQFALSRLASCTLCPWLSASSGCHNEVLSPVSTPALAWALWQGMASTVSLGAEIQSLVVTQQESSPQSMHNSNQNRPPSPGPAW